jgi:phosphatidate cytidylyltransferase
MPFLRQAPDTHPLLLRVASALVLAPIALAALWLGPPFLPGLVLVVVAAMGWEWAKLCRRGGFGPTGILIVAAGLAGVAALALGAGGWALAAAAAAAGVVLAATARAGTAEPLWAAAGTLWIGLGAIAFLWLAAAPAGGRATALWLLAVVWATDIAAYAAGRSIGGPRLAPRLSPNKTWAGFAGGVLSAGLIGAIAALLVGASPASLVAVSLALGVAAQLGDLAESLAKRHFGVKDASQLIPGHGGVLDRVDGLLAAAVLAGALALIAGASPLAWR